MKQRKLWMPLDIQFFADGGEGVTEGQGEENQSQKPSFDDILKDKDYQSDFDRKMTSAKTKWETTIKAEYEQKLEAAKTEAEKLSKMKAEEKAQYELEKKQKELDDKLKAISYRELKAEAQSQLVEMGISKDYAEFINCDSAENVKASIDKLVAIRKADLEKAVNERLGSNEPPKKGGNNADSELEKLKKIMGI